MTKCEAKKEEISLRGNYASVRCAQLVMRLAELGASGGFIKKILDINCAERKVRALISEMNMKARRRDEVYRGKKGRHTSSVGWFVHDPERLIHCTYLVNFLRVVTEARGEPQDAMEKAEILIEAYTTYLRWEGVDPMTSKIPFTRFHGVTRLMATGQLAMRTCKQCQNDYLDRALSSRNTCPLCLQACEFSNSGDNHEPLKDDGVLASAG